jgi:hypothetical protein
MGEFEHGATVDKLAADRRIGVPFLLPPTNVLTNFVGRDELGGHPFEELIEVV